MKHKNNKNKPMGNFNQCTKKKDVYNSEELIKKSYYEKVDNLAFELYEAKNNLKKNSNEINDLKKRMDNLYKEIEELKKKNENDKFNKFYNY